MRNPIHKDGKARRDFANAIKDYAAQQPDRGDAKLFGSDGSWSLNEIAREIEKNTKKGKKFYADLKDVLKFAPPRH